MLFDAGLDLEKYFPEYVLEHFIIEHTMWFSYRRHELYFNLSFRLKRCGLLEFPPGSLAVLSAACH